MSARKQKEAIEQKMSSDTKHATLKSIGTALFWLAGWPIVMLVILSFLSVFILGPAVSTIDATANPSAIRFYFFGIVLFFAVLCSVLILSFNRTGRRFMKRGAGVLRIYLWLGIITGGCILAAIPDASSESADIGIQTSTTTDIFASELTHDPNIVALLQQVGATDIDLIDEQYVDGYNDPKFSDKWGEYQAFINQATQKFAYGKLTIRRGLDAEQEKISVAHEYLHHVWFKLLDGKTKDSLTAQLIGMYGNDPVIRERVSEYVQSGTLYPTELFSYYCTESSDGYLTDYVLETCNTYINRSVLRLAR